MVPVASSASATDASDDRLGIALGSGTLHGWAHVGIMRACLRAAAPGRASVSQGRRPPACSASSATF